MLASENDYINEASNTMLRLSAEQNSLIQQLFEENKRLRANNGKVLD